MLKTLQGVNAVADDTTDRIKTNLRMEINHTIRQILKILRIINLRYQTARTQILIICVKVRVFIRFKGIAKNTLDALKMVTEVLINLNLHADRERCGIKLP